MSGLPFAETIVQPNCDPVPQNVNTAYNNAKTKSTTKYFEALFEALFEASCPRQEGHDDHVILHTLNTATFSQKQKKIFRIASTKLFLSLVHSVPPLTNRLKTIASEYTTCICVYVCMHAMNPIDTTYFSTENWEGTELGKTNLWIPGTLQRCLPVLVPDQHKSVTVVQEVSHNLH